MYRSRDTERDRLRNEIVDLLRNNGVQAQHVGHAFAHRHGLHPTDLQALMAVMDAERRGDPLTPGRLAEQLGLSSGATTAAVDRLERAGHLRRSRESSDRRVVHLRYGEAGQELAMRFFRPLAERTDEVMAGYTDADLATIHRFLTAMSEAMAHHHQEVRAAAPE